MDDYDDFVDRCCDEDMRAERLAEIAGRALLRKKNPTIVEMKAAAIVAAEVQTAETTTTNDERGEG
jgi:hypothetical protein